MAGDYFSLQAQDYAAFRPRYPDAIFEALAVLAPSRERAWDCATGTGQAAGPLSAYFRHVIATDLSWSQIAQAAPHPHVNYCVARAESSPIASATIDLIVVAQALHWFNRGAFYTEVQRALKRDGVLAIMSYGSASLDTPPLAEALRHFEHVVVGPFWPPGRELVGKMLTLMEFPFEEISVPAFQLEARWTLDQLLGYVRSWSATTRYRQARGTDPTMRLAETLRPLWGPPTTERRVTWPFSIRVGRSEKPRARL